MAASRNRLVDFLFVVIALVSCTTAQTTHVVGGTTGWTIPPSATTYINWVSNQTFRVGDSLVFNFAARAHDVTTVTRAAYDACDASSPIGAVQTASPVTVTLSSQGPQYYFCSIQGHCSTGQKLVINVVGAAASPPPTTTTSSPPLTRTPTPPTGSATPPTTSTVPQSFEPPTEISAGAIVGIVVASVVVVVLIILAALWKKGYLGGKYHGDKGDIPTGPKRQNNVKLLLESCKFLALQQYKYSDIRVMTKSFKHTIGKGGYGCVFKGTLRNDGRLVAVKVLNESKGNGEEFINEVVTIGRTNHVNVVSLLGFCIEGTKRALVYEFMSNGSLEKYIFNEKTLSNKSIHLGWEKLYQIALGIARGLEYLHCRCNTRILHFDIKPHNILLDHDFHPKISDFGLAKLCPTKESIVSMVGARGTMGYIAPELYCRNLGGVSHKSDVYSYGMMVLEMIGGRKNLDVTVENMSGIYFPHWIYNQLKRDFEIEEPEEMKLEGAQEILKDDSAKKMIIVALWCIQTHPANRPSMTKVVEMLEGSNELLQMPPNPSLDPLSLS